MNQPVFVCGALRSGSSVTHLMLHHHPELRNPGEFDFFFEQISASGKYPSVESYHDWLSIHRIFHSKDLIIDSSLAYDKLIYSFVEQLSRPNVLLALNIHRNFDLIPYLFSDAKFVHLIRDPRDVARSSIAMGWASNVYYGIEHWLKTEQAWKRLQNKISPEQYIEIRFEDLIISPENVLSKLCSFIGVPYSEDMLSYASKSTYSKPDPSLVRQWKTKLSIREIQYVELKAQALMKELGYELSGHPIRPPNMIERFKLRLENKIYKLKFRIKKYGIVLFCKELFSRVFGLKSQSKKARLMINAIDKRRLK